MGSLNLDTNTWYQVTSPQLDDYSMRGTNLWASDGTTGALWMDKTNVTGIGGFSWQFWPWNSSVYLLRCKDCGSTGYLAVDVGDDGAPADQDETGNTILITANYDVGGDSIFWEIKPWDDGTYYFSNLANGSAWRMNALSNTLMVMDSNITSGQEGEHYDFTSLSAIDNSDYSTVDVPSPSNTGTALTSTAATISSTSSSGSGTVSTSVRNTSSPTSAASSSSSSSGLSTGAAAAIGASVGAVAVIVCMLVLFFIWRRRTAAKREKQEQSHQLEHNKTTQIGFGGNSYATAGTHEVPGTQGSPGIIPRLEADSVSKHEMWTPPSAELRGNEQQQQQQQQQPLELPGNAPVSYEERNNLRG